MTPFAFQFVIGHQRSQTTSCSPLISPAERLHRFLFLVCLKYDKRPYWVFQQGCHIRIDRRSPSRYAEALRLKLLISVLGMRGHEVVGRMRTIAGEYTSRFGRIRGP